ncbi:hypothetical protein [Neobacillus drentensis]|uniref:hypothetical protein n=1 Tax=Neobacillus drentensis TaxID=220684 RepID=UPI000AFD8C73|nr:hypothetical protein [Neobacillus drentensis]
MSIEKMSFDDLLKEYRMIWNNRLLDTEGRNSKETLFDAIKRELQDANSHPRTRKNKYEKYYSAIKRVIDSTVSEEDKLLIIKIHNQVMEELS